MSSCRLALGEEGSKAFAVHRHRLGAHNAPASFKLEYLPSVNYLGGGGRGGNGGQRKNQGDGGGDETWKKKRRRRKK